MNIVNTSVTSNKANLRTVMNVLIKLPKYMDTMRTDSVNIIDNVFEKISCLKSSITCGVINKQEPESSLRGRTSALQLDEVAYLGNIAVAYSAIAFVYNTYSVMAKRTNTPAPFTLTSTPADLITESGAFWHEMWEGAYFVKYEEIIDLLPHEIKAYFLKKGITTVKVEQYWYQFSGRATKVNIYDPEFIEKHHYKLMDPTTPHSEILDIDPGLYEWLVTTKAITKTLTNTKKDIYCMFLASMENAIFEETVIESLTSSKRSPRQIIDVSFEEHKAELKLYQKIEPVELSYDFFGVWDISASIRGGGDYVACVILNRRDYSVAGSVRFRITKVNKIHLIIKNVIELGFNGEMAFSLETNSLGVAVKENCEDDPYLKERMFYSFFKPKYGKEKDVSKKEYGMFTTAANRPLMITAFLDYVIDNQQTIRDGDLIADISSLIDKGGKIQSASGSHDDMVMSLAMCLYLLLNFEETVNRISMTTFKKEIEDRIIHNMNTTDGIQLATKPADIRAEKNTKLSKFYEDSMAELREDAKTTSNMFSLLNK